MKTRLCAAAAIRGSVKALKVVKWRDYIAGQPRRQRWTTPPPPPPPRKKEVMTSSLRRQWWRCIVSTLVELLEEIATDCWWASLALLPNLLLPSSFYIHLDDCSVKRPSPSPPFPPRSADDYERQGLVIRSVLTWSLDFPQVWRSLRGGLLTLRLIGGVTIVIRHDDVKFSPFTWPTSDWLVGWLDWKTFPPYF